MVTISFFSLRTDIPLANLHIFSIFLALVKSLKFFWEPERFGTKSDEINKITTKASMISISVNPLLIFFFFLMVVLNDIT